MKTLDMDHLTGWIGRTEVATDTLTPRLIDEHTATFAPHGFAPDGVPLSIHWCLAPPTAPADQLGHDGHPAKGGFLPPVPLDRRMWAGGQIDFVAPLAVGDQVTRRSEIADVVQKQGKNGPMVFVTVQHEYHNKHGLALRDRQDIVYLQPASKPAPVLDKSAPHADHSVTVPVSSTLLFRYSALTFNGHRIHYDPDFCRTVEGYPDLVVHGPMQASFLLQYGAKLANGRALKSFSYRSQRPLFGNEPLVLNAGTPGDSLDLWTSGTLSAPAMKAELGFH
jgi:3-methylfumaryl-CoA hydratase